MNWNLLFKNIAKVFFLDVAAKPDCGPNATLENEGWDCETCDSRFPKCAINHKQQCYCKIYYIREDNVTNKCILKSDCPKLQ